MAVYGASLQRLAELAAQRARQEQGPSPDPSEHADTAVGTNAESVAGSPSMTESAVGPVVPLTETITTLLDLPKARIESLLSEWGDSGGKALLVLIHRLASVEEQLAELRGSRPSTPSSPPPASNAFSPVARPKAIVYDADKSNLLEQVFQKNLSLRRSDMR